MCNRTGEGNCFFLLKQDGLRPVLRTVQGGLGLATLRIGVGEIAKLISLC